MIPPVKALLYVIKSADLVKIKKPLGGVGSFWHETNMKKNKKNCIALFTE